MSEPRSRVLLADDHPMMLGGLRKLLDPAYEVVGAVADGLALLAVAERLRPDLVIADIAMPGLDGVEATRRLRQIVPACRVLILSIHAEPSWVRAAFAAGACGYLTKCSAPEEIEAAVQAVLADQLYVSPMVARAAIFPGFEQGGGSLLAATPRRPAGRCDALLGSLERKALTGRELDIFHLLGAGMANKEIARRLGVSVTTVRSHLRSLYDKLGPASRVELALYAAQTGPAAR